MKGVRKVVKVVISWLLRAWLLRAWLLRAWFLWLCFLCVLLLVLAIPGCQTTTSPTRSVPFVDVATLPNPKLPDWIEQINPTGQVKSLSQIRVRFKEPLIPLERLESPDQQGLLQKFELTPSLPGTFRFLTPRMVGFEPEQALPMAIRVRVTLKSGLSDLKKHTLMRDLAWTFNTEPIKLTELPGVSDTHESINDAAPIALKPTLKVTSNTELDLDSLRSHLKLVPQGTQDSVPVAVALSKDKTESDVERKSAENRFDPSTQNWIYDLTPQRDLDKGKIYKLDFQPGLRPLHGNLASKKVFSSQLKTYGALALQKVEYTGQPDESGAYGRFVKGRAVLNFNNGLVAESAKTAITVTPPLKETDHLVQAYDGDRTLSLNPWAFEPNRSYTITLGTALKDEFGQTLEKPITFNYETGDVAADLWAPTGFNIFPADKAMQLNLSAVNLPDGTYKAAYRPLRPEELVYLDTDYPTGDKDILLPPRASWQFYKVPNPKRNETVEITVPLREKLGRAKLGSATGLLAYGVSARTNQYQDNGKSKWREPEFYGMVQLTNLGVFAQWLPDSGLVRVHHLSDGSAVEGAQVEVYESKLEAKGQSPGIPCATVATDKTGMVNLKRPDFKACLAADNQDLSKPPQLLVVAREQQDWAFTRVLEFSGSYGYGADLGWNGGKAESRGTIFSDRQLYQPSELGWFTGVATYLQNGTLKQDKNAKYTVTLEGPEGKKKNLGTQTTNVFGTFSIEVPLSADQPLGYYTIRAKGEGDREISGEFRVAEFKPPNFKVDLSLGQKFASINQTIEANAQSNYLFGPAVEGGKANFYVTRKFTEYTPKGWEPFSFGQRWYWPEKKPEVPTDVLQTSQDLDKKGHGKTTVTVASDLPYPMTYRVDAQVADVSNLSVADSQTFTALPSDRLIGLKSDFVAEAQKAFPVEVIVTDPEGKAISGQQVRLELQKMSYSSVAQVVEGSQTPHDQVEYKTVATAEVRSEDKSVSVSLTPPDSGSYRVRANLVGAKDDLTATDLQIWATGDNPVFWGDRYLNEHIEVKLDKANYAPGETATAIIQSPYAEGELYFAVVRNQVLYQTVQTVKGSTPKVQFQVTPEMLPNAAVEAVLVRRGAPLSKTEPENLKKLVGIGFAPFKIGLDSQVLKVEVVPAAGTTPGKFLAPGATQTLDLKLQTAQGKPIKGQFTVMAVNDAVLQLSGYRVPDLVETVYAEQPISTRFADNRADVVLQPLSSPLDKGWGFGGGFSAGAADTRIRKNFKALAYFNGAVLTDAEGKARVTFPLPDDLTTWRVMAVAVDEALRYGKGEATFITSKPLIANPVLPQFARPGDRFEAGLAVTNNTGQTGNLAIGGAFHTDQPSTTSPLEFAEQGGPSPTAKLQTSAEMTTRAYRFPILAKRAGKGTLQFNTQLGSDSDAFAVPLEVKPLTITEQVVESGTTHDRIKIPLNKDKDVIQDIGGLEISLASTLIPELALPAQQVLDKEQLPFLEPAASQLAIASHLQRLGKTYGQTFLAFKPKEKAEQALESIQKLQRPDGGFAAWPGEEKSDPYGTTYAAETIANATEAFAGQPNVLQKDSDWVVRLRNYLQKLVADPGQQKGCKAQSCKNRLRLNALVALAEFGDLRNDFLSDLYEQRAQLDPVAQIKLARHLTRFPNWKTEAAKLTQQIQQNVYETGRTATLNLPQGSGWLGSRTTQQAELLRLSVAEAAKSELLDRQVRALLDLRREGHWGSSYDNAQALGALVAHSKLEPIPPSFMADARLANKSLGSNRFEGGNIILNVPMANLPNGKHDLELQKSGKGVLHYLTAFRYRLQGNVSGQLQGLRVSRTIRLANQNQVLQTQGLSAPKEPLRVQPGQVFDIGLEVIADHPVNHVVIEDPLPAGFEVVDIQFQTATAYFQPLNQSWEISYQTIRRDRITAYGDHLDAGVYNLHYLVRSVTPGTFQWPGAEVHLQYAPEEFGRSAATQLKIE